MHLTDILIIGVYLATLVAIGIRFSGRQKTTDSYFVAGRSVPGALDPFQRQHTLGLAR